MKFVLLLLTLFFTGNIQAFQENTSPKIKTADSLLSKEEYRRSALVWKEVLEQSSETIPQYALYKSKLLFSEGKIEETAGNFAHAVESYKKAQKALGNYIATAETPFRIDIYNALYHSLAYAGKWNDALKTGNEGLYLMDDTIDKEVRADYIYDLGYINDQLGNYEEAIDLYRQSIFLYKSLDANKHFDLGLAYNNLGTAYRQIGFFSERLKSFETARFYWEKDATINSSYLTTLYGNLMKMYIEYGDREKASELFKTISALSQTDPPPADVVNYFRLRIIYQTFAGESNNIERELEEFRNFFETLSFKKRMELSHHFLAALVNVGDYYQAESKYDIAAIYLSEALGIADKYAQPYYTMFTHTILGQVAESKNQTAIAIDHLETALAQREQINIGQVNEVNILIRKATLQAKKGMMDKAFQNVHEALSILGGTTLTDPKAITEETFQKQHSSFFVMALKDAAGFYSTIYKTTNDCEDILNAKYLYELAASVFALYYQNGEYNMNLNNLNKTINEGIYEVHVALEVPLSPEMLTLIEGNNSQVLRNEFERKNLQFLNVTESTLAHRNFLHLKLQNLDSDNPAEQDTRQKLADSIALLDSQIASQEPLYRSFYTEDVTLQKIQDYLNEKELLIKYFTGKEATYAVIISQKEIKLFKLGGTDELQEMLKSYFPMLSDPLRNTGKHSRELYTHLIAPWEQELGKYTTLTIIPDDFLHYLPFEVLKSQGFSLVQSHEIKYANSLDLWLLKKKSLPEIQKNKTLFAAFAPLYGGAEINALSVRGDRFKNLAGAKKEAQLIAANLNGDIFLDDDATLDNFMERTTSYRIYHLAMHAIMDEKEHTRSGLIFQGNGFLNFTSLYGMYFPAELVVLSACNTGVGKLAAGEGLLSLSRALTYAGVRSSVYSLWEVPDAETSIIMLSFYKYLQEGKNKTTALAAAKRDFLKNNPLKSHPYYWAGFVINGDASPIVANKSSLIWYFAAAVLIVGLGFCFWLFKKNRLSV